MSAKNSQLQSGPTITIDGTRDCALKVDHAIIAGWTGRDRAAVDHHIAEVAALGVAPPSTVPLYYRISAAQITTSNTIEVLGPDTSGEVEPVLLFSNSELLLGVGSDHTDRKLEAVSVAASKQICSKPIADKFWSFARVGDRLDDIVIRSWIRDNEKEDWTLYQEGGLSSLLPLPQLAQNAPNTDAAGQMQPGTLMMCGTLSAIGGIRPAEFFRMEMRDPHDGAAIEHSYSIKSHPVVT